MFNTRLDHPSNRRVDPASQLAHRRTQVHVRRSQSCIAIARDDMVLNIRHNKEHKLVSRVRAPSIP